MEKELSQAHFFLNSTWYMQKFVFSNHIRYCFSRRSCLIHTHNLSENDNIGTLQNVCKARGELQECEGKRSPTSALPAQLESRTFVSLRFLARFCKPQKYAYACRFFLYTYLKDSFLHLVSYSSNDLGNKICAPSLI